MKWVLLLLPEDTKAQGVRTSILSHTAQAVGYRVSACNHCAMRV